MYGRHLDAGPDGAELAPGLPSEAHARGWSAQWGAGSTQSAGTMRRRTAKGRMLEKQAEGAPKKVETSAARAVTSAC